MHRSHLIRIAIGAAVVLLFVIQLVPYGRDHTNPPGPLLATWDAPGTKELARRACFDCHSNETRWPWYSSIAPVSWRIQRHVAEGRRKLNFTAFDPANEKMAEEASEAAKTVRRGTMPPPDYLLMHPEARLTAPEKQALAAGLEATFAAYAGADEGGEAGRDEAEGYESGERHEPHR